jgi:hypothetical protein
MRSRVIVKCREILGYYYEKVMEWVHSICCRIFASKATGRSLIEEYVIYEPYTCEDYVKEFLSERTQNSTANNYCIRIMTAPCEANISPSNGSTQVIGKARLLRKNTLIDEAKLVIKNHEKSLIYWEFEK